jgi:anti-sigma regulatory factor (Ser/Thr protein kinase)
MSRTVDLIDFNGSLGIQEFEGAIAPHNPLDSGMRMIAFSYLGVTFVPLETHVHALCLYNQLAHAGVEVQLIWPENDTMSYASRMGFFGVLDPRVVVHPSRPHKAHAESYRAANPALLELTPIVRTDHTGADLIVRAIYDSIVENLAQLPDADHIAGHVSTVATELVQNIFDWSETPIPGVIGIQRYEASGRVALTIADSGVGITTSIRNHNPARAGSLSDLQIILKALQEGLSSRSDPGGGAGLTLCAEIAGRYEGRLLVRTNRTWSKLIVKAKRSGRNWNINEVGGARIDGTILTFDLLLDRLGARKTKRLDKSRPGA